MSFFDVVGDAAGEVAVALKEREINRIKGINPNIPGLPTDQRVSPQIQGEPVMDSGANITTAVAVGGVVALAGIGLVLLFRS